MQRSAILSPCRDYRYSLARIWSPTQPTVLFVGLNPSTADDLVDDPTVRRCVGFARRWGFGGMTLVNLFAYRSKDPAELLRATDPIGPGNDDHILEGVRAAERVLLVWGTKGGHLNRDQDILSVLPKVHCLGITKAGHPKHPLYLAGKTRSRLFRALPARAQSTRHASA